MWHRISRRTLMKITFAIVVLLALGAWREMRKGITEAQTKEEVERWEKRQQHQPPPETPKP